MRNAHSEEIALLISELNKLSGQAKAKISKLQTLDEIEAQRIHFLGKKGRVSEILGKMKLLAKEDRPKVGEVANTVRDRIETLVTDAKERITTTHKNILLAQGVDITLPGRNFAMGRLHPLTQASDRLLEVFKSLGFDFVYGPEIEHDFYNFEALNIPKDHPAREMQDTFYLEKDVVLRTHTSPVQIRTLLAFKDPPIRVASLGRVYRRDEDATHSPMFHQIELLYVDKSVSIADLKGTLMAFVQRLFGKNVNIRLRPSFFPFTEPSVEVDMSCFACLSKGCRLCKMTGWIEILGAGMIDPEVFKSVKYDPEKVSGFAFGMGVERIAMLLFGILDIRLFYDNDIRFLRQF